MSRTDCSTIEEPPPPLLLFAAAAAAGLAVDVDSVCADVPEAGPGAAAADFLAMLGACVLREEGRQATFAMASRIVVVLVGGASFMKFVTS